MERRREPRTPLTLKVTLEGAGSAGSVLLATGDLSTRGAFVFAAEPPPVGAAVLVEVGFPGLLPMQRLRGVVRWVREQSPFAHGRVGGFGVEWDAPIPDEALKRVLEQPEVLDLVEVAEEVPSFRVLVCDDSPQIRTMIKKSLTHATEKEQRLFLEVIEVGEGASAWGRLEQGGIDLLIMDWFMPGLDGPALLARVRATEATRSLPVVVCSAGGDDVKRAAEAGGADLYLQKPIRILTILETVYRLLRVQRAGEEGST